MIVFGGSCLVDMFGKIFGAEILKLAIISGFRQSIDVNGVPKYQN